MSFQGCRTINQSRLAHWPKGKILPQTPLGPVARWPMEADHPLCEPRQLGDASDSGEYP